MLILKCSAIFLHVALALLQAAESKGDIVDGTSKIVNTTKVVAELQNIAGTISPQVLPNKTPTPSNASTTEQPTTTPVISTTSSPSTTSAPALDYWLVKENGVVCILAKVEIKLDINFNHSKDYAVTVPKKAVANGTCGQSEQSLHLSWDNNTVKMNFKANDTIHKYYLDFVEVNITTADNKTVVLSTSEIAMFETPLSHSYLCSYSDPLKFSQKNDSVQVSFSNIKLEAFKKDDSIKFSTISACPPDTPDIVPIVVGCALTILVITVLIAYLVSRRKTQARGYLSM